MNYTKPDGELCVLRRRYFTGIFTAVVFITGLTIAGCGIDMNYMTFDSDAARTTFEPGIVLESNSDENATESGISLMTSDLTVIKGNEKSTLSGNPKFNAKAVFVADDDENKPLYVKHALKKLYPASLTKIMTAYVAYKYCDDLEKKFIVTEDCLELPDAYAKKMGLQVGDSITIHDLLRASLIPSCNDAAKSLAVAVAGSEEEFVSLMNDEALNLGATRSHFTNCHGLHDKNHYTTLYDLYLIMHELMKNPDFVKCISSANTEINYNDTYGNPKTVTMKSTDQYLTGSAEVPEGITVIGGKTGTTDEAGSCMLLYVKNSSGKGYFTGILGSSDSLNLYASLSTIFDAIK